MSRVLILAVLLILPAALCRADEPTKVKPEKLPAPKVKGEPSITILPYLPRSDTREVWHHYGVNRLGRFVPRVLVYPEGAYYSRDLQSYPWPANRTTALVPNKVD